MLLEMRIKPIIAVIPDNKNREFFIEKEKGGFLGLCKGEAEN